MQIAYPTHIPINNDSWNRKEYFLDRNGNHMVVFISKDGHKYFYKINDDKSVTLHNEEGPAIYRPNGCHSWWLEGENCFSFDIWLWTLEKIDSDHRLAMQLKYGGKNDF